MCMHLKCTSMFMKFVRDFNTTSVNAIRHELSKPKEKWDLMSAVCVERKPILSKELNDIERKVQAMLTQVEEENSLKSDHELRCMADQVRAAKLKDGTLNLDMIDDALQQTGQDFVDIGLTELKNFKPASRLTKADEQNDIRSTQRKLDRHLVLLTKEKLGDTMHWILPFTKIQEGETLRQTAERSLAESFNKCIRAKFYGNAPCGFYKYKYPKSLREKSDVVGAKIFFFKAQYIEGTVENKKLEYTWASREEMSKLLLADYNKNVQMFLIDE